MPPGRWRRTGGRCPVPGAAAGERRYTLRRGAVLTAELFADGRPLQFLHPLVRSAVYEQLAPGARAQAHARAAQLLASDGAQSEQVAIQILACEPAGDAAAVRASRAAAAAALVRGAPDTAVTYLRRAWTEPSVTQIREGLLDSRELLAAFQQYARYWPRCSCGGCDGGGLLTAEGFAPRPPSRTRRSPCSVGISMSSPRRGQTRRIPTRVSATAGKYVDGRTIRVDVGRNIRVETAKPLQRDPMSEPTSRSNTWPHHTMGWFERCGITSAGFAQPSCRIRRCTTVSVRACIEQAEKY